jgi:hypothetical protein
MRRTDAGMMIVAGSDYQKTNSKTLACAVRRRVHTSSFNGKVLWSEISAKGAPSPLSGASRGTLAVFELPACAIRCRAWLSVSSSHALIASSTRALAANVNEHAAELPRCVTRCPYTVALARGRSPAHACLPWAGPRLASYNPTSGRLQQGYSATDSGGRLRGLIPSRGINHSASSIFCRG